MSKYLAVGISFENQASWSIPINSEKKNRVLKAIRRHGGEPEEVLLIEGNVVLHHWSQLNGHF